MVDRFERFSLAVSVIFRCWHKIASDEMKKHGLKGPHATYLTTMYQYPDGLNATQLCDLCGKDKADVSRMMSIMEIKGLVKKEGVNYRAVLTLTENGRAVAEHVRERVMVAVEAAGKGLSEEQRTIFYDALSLIAFNLQKISREGLPQA